MLRKTIITTIISLGIISLTACADNHSAEIGIKGHLQDEAGNPLSDVAISYSKSLITSKTDAAGNFTIDQPRTLWIEFKKEGYQLLSTKITDFSDDGTYDFKKIILKKNNSKSSAQKDISFSKESNAKGFLLSGKVSNIFNEPLNDVTITLNDPLKDSYSQIHEGDFSFRVLDNQIFFTKDGFQKTVLQVPVFEKGARNITLLENDVRKGIFLLKSGKYIPLPQTKLLLKSEEKIGSILWGGNFSYKITDFFYPPNAKEFKIEDDPVLRFFIYEPDHYSVLFEAGTEDDYLCTANYKLSTSPSPDSKKERIAAAEIYPAKYSIQEFDSPRIIEFKPSKKNRNYVFVNTETKKGYYFTY